MWGWLQAIVQGLLSGLNQWLSGQQARQDAVSLGKADEANSEAQAAVATAQAQAQAAVDAPRTVAGAEGELDSGTF